MTILEMKQRKKELGYTNQQLADLSGIPIGTLQKILSGSTKAPRRENILALEKVLYSASGNPGMYENISKKAFVQEPSVGYTYKDYLALPQDHRMELIDGVFYDMTSPTTLHQAIGGYIYKKLMDFVLENQGECMPFMAPVDVCLDADDKTIVQPDVFVVCNRNKLQKGIVIGAPDLVVEVLSPSTRKKDIQLKLYKYGNAGVREYWMVDPKLKKVIVNDLGKEELPASYTFESSIPVLIWGGECKIDFAEIYARIKFLFDE